MGKDLHYSIIPYVKNILQNHDKVEEIIELNNEDYFAYRIVRNSGLTDVILVLSDEYFFSENHLLSIPELLNNGGFILLAKPESRGYQGNLPSQKLIVGKLSRLLGALNRSDFWNYTPPTRPNGNRNFFR